MKNNAPSAKLRRTLYWPEDLDDQLRQIAERYEKQGKRGLFNSKGQLNRAAVIRYLVNKELGEG